MTRVEALAASPCGRFLAVARASGRVDIFEDSVVVGVLHGSSKMVARACMWVGSATHDASTDEALAGYRLITAGLNGDLVQWNPSTCLLVDVTPVNAGSIFGADVKEDELVVACGDGTVRSYRLDHDDDVTLTFVRRFQPHSTRLLCVAFTDSHVLAGSEDSTVLKYDKRTGQVLDSCTVQRLLSITRENGKIRRDTTESAVWALAWLPQEATFVSGDSIGHVTLWDEKTMTSIQKFSNHEADVLSLKPTPDHKIIYSVGVDSRVSAYVLMEGEWTLSSWRFPCKSQTRALAVGKRNEGHLLAVGDVSGDVRVLETVLPFRRAHYGFRSLPLPQKDALLVAQSSSFVLGVANTQLSLWNLREVSESGPNSLNMSPEDIRQWRALGLPNHSPELVATLDFLPESISGVSGQMMNLAAAAISPSGRLLAASTLTALRVVRFDPETMDLEEILRVEQPVFKLTFDSDDTLRVSTVVNGRFAELELEVDETPRVRREAPVSRVDVFAR